MFKIALISAYIGNPGKSELKITPECKKELDNYGVDLYLFNNNHVNLLDEHYIPTSPFIKTGRSKIQNIIEHFRFSQYLYPTNEANHNRLLAKIPRMQFYKLLPKEYDYYIWCDSKFTLCSYWLEYVLFLIERYSEYDFLVSEHCERSSITEELNYMIRHMKDKSENLCSKYNMADMYYQVHSYVKDKNFKDKKLFETGFLVFSKRILQHKEFLDDWYGHNFYYTIQDQLSLPYLCNKHKIKVYSIKQRIYDMPFTKYNYYN